MCRYLLCVGYWIEEARRANLAQRVATGIERGVLRPHPRKRRRLSTLAPVLPHEITGEPGPEQRIRQRP